MLGLLVDEPRPFAAAAAVVLMLWARDQHHAADPWLPALQGRIGGT
jgi:hypothetical protein